MATSCKLPFNDQVLEVLINKAGFCSWGHPKEAAYFLHKLLGLAPFYNDWEAVTRLIPGDGCYFHILYLVTDLDLMEHGGGVGGSWCSSEGDDVKALLNSVDWRRRPELTITAEATPIKDPPSRIRRTREHRISMEAAFCGCGRPEDAFEFVKDVFSEPLTINASHLVELIPDLGTRQFYLYQLYRLGLVDQKWRRTPRGKRFVSKLAKVDDFDKD